MKTALLAALLCLTCAWPGAAQKVPDARAAALEIFNATRADVIEYHLLESTLDQLDKLEPAEREDFVSALMLGKSMPRNVSASEKMEGGGILLRSLSDESVKTGNAEFDQELVVGTNAQLTFRVDRDGTFSAPIRLEMRLENGIWCLVSVAIGDKSPLPRLDDPELAQKVRLDARRRRELSALINLQNLLTAVNLYRIDTAGYPPDWSTLVRDRISGPPSLVTNAEFNGYIFSYTQPDPAGFVLQAFPKERGKSGDVFYYVDQSGEIRKETGIPANSESPLASSQAGGSSNQ